MTTADIGQDVNSDGVVHLIDEQTYLNKGFLSKSGAQYPNDPRVKLYDFL
jgi:hypothetical protein